MRPPRFALTLTLALLVALAAPLAAQTPIARYDLQVFAAGVNPASGSPITTTPLLAGIVTCNSAPIAVPATVVNPTRVQWDDGANAGKVCFAPLASTVLTALPNGIGYFVTLTAVDTAGQTSGRSAASNPFSQQGPPPVRTNVKVL